MRELRVRRSMALLALALVIVVAATVYQHLRSTHQSTAAHHRGTLTVRAAPIQERFTLLACSPETTIGLEGCAEHRVVALDHDIDRVQGTIDSLLRHRRAQEQFARAEIEWSDYRNAACVVASDANEGGSLAPLSFAECLVGLDIRHLSELHVLVGDYSTS